MSATNNSAALEQIVIVKNKFYTVIYHPQYNYITFASIGFVPSAELRKNSDLILETMIKYKCVSLLGDNTQTKAISKDDQDWVISDWGIRAQKAGLFFFASVVSQDLFNNIAVKNIIDKGNNSNLETVYFDKLSDAHTWIIEKAASVLGK